MPSLFDKFTKSMKQLFSYKSEDDDFSEDEMNTNKRLKICSTQNENSLHSIYVLNAQQYVMMH